MDKFQITAIIKGIRTFTSKSHSVIFPACLAITLNAQAETYDFNFNQFDLPTFGNVPLTGSGNFELFDFSESFQLGGFTNPRVNLGFKKVSLGNYGFQASGYVNGSSDISYDYNLGEHNYNLDIPLSIDLNVSSIDANNQITISSSYTLGNQSGITSTVDTSNAFFNIDPTFNLAAGISARGCVKHCTDFINERVSINAFKEDLIDVHASNLSVEFDRDTKEFEDVGAQLNKISGLFGIESNDTSNYAVGKLARSFGLLGLDVHTPGLDFNQIPTDQSTNKNNSFLLASSGEDQFFNLEIDMIDFAASAALSGKGGTLTKLMDKEISTTLGGVNLNADWELIDAEVTTSAAIKQDFGFNGTPTIQLALSNGKNITINAGESIVVQLADGIESIDVDPTFALSGDFSSKLALKLDASANLNLLGYNFDLPLSQIGVGYGFNLGKFGVGNINKFHQPTVIHEEISTEVGLYSLTRQLDGFASFAGQTLTSQLPNASEIGTHGNDVLRGSFGNNSLTALAGNDILIGGLGNDILDGGLGTDTADYQSFTDADGDHLQSGNGVTVSLLTNTATSSRPNNPSIIDTDRLISIENVSGSKLNDNITGNTENNVLKGRGGNDVLKGDAGNDKIYGGDGNDFISGGNGNDILDGGDGMDRVFGDNGDDLIVVSATMIEHPLKSIFQFDEIDGGTGTDTIQFIGKQAIEGYPLLFIKPFFYTAGIYADLEEGKARLYAGLNGNQGVIGKFSIASLDNLNRFKNGFASITNVENLIGTKFDDVIKGNNENNIINGGEGYDFLYGRGGDDTFIYSLGDVRHRMGDNHYFGGDGIDTLDASNHFTSVDIDQSSSRINVENVIGSRFNDVLTGDDNNNVIDGHLGSNTIDARGGDDIIIVRNTGAAATNTVIGGAGHDAVVLSNVVNQKNVVASYNQGNLELALNGEHKVVLDGQYTTPTQATESFYSDPNLVAVNVGGSFEQLVSTGDFNRYKVESDFTTTESMTVVTHLETQETTTLTNQHTLTNESVLVSEGDLINQGTLVNTGTLIVNNRFQNDGVFENTNTGRTHYSSSNTLAGVINNDGLIDVVESETLNITGQYSGSGYLVGDINFNELAMNIGNSPGSANLFGLASFNNVDFNLEIGEDEFGNLIYDNFNIFGDFILGDNLSVTLSLLDDLSFKDLIDTDFNFINVSESIFNPFDIELSIADLFDYKVEIFDGFFANWYVNDNSGYSLSFNGTELFLASGGILPTDVPEPSSLGLFAMVGGLILIRRRNILVLLKRS
jgi:Ca2+-binding RTX toxin-like protein